MGEDHLRHCMLCQATFAEHTSSTSIEYHLRNKHKAFFESAAPKSTKRPCTDQQSLHNCLDNAAIKDAFNNVVENFIHHPSLPISLCDSIAFRRTLKSSAGVTSRNVRQAILVKDADVMKTLRRLLQCKLVGLQIDGGKTISNAKVLGIGFTLQGKFYCWKVFECDKGAVWDAEFYRGVIKECIEEIEECGAVVVSVSADNESSSSSGIKLVQGQLSHLLHNRCYCHTCELLILDLQKTTADRPAPAMPMLAAVDEQCNKIVVYIRGNKYAGSALARAQGTNALVLLKPSNTRKWSSTFLVLCRFLKLFEFIMAIEDFICVGAPPPVEQTRAKTEWLAMKQHVPNRMHVEAVRDFLYWIYVAEQVLQRDVSSVIHAASLFESICMSLGQLLNGRPLPAMIQQSMDAGRVAEACLVRREMLKQSGVYMLALFCWPSDVVDPQLHASATRELRAFVTQSWPKWQAHATNFELPEACRVDCNDAPEMQRSLAAFLFAACSELTTYTSNHNDIKAARDLFFDHSRVVQASLVRDAAIGVVKGRVAQGVSVAQFWSSIASSLPHLFVVVKVLLCVCASEAAVERMFSKEGFIHNKYRNRLSHLFVEALVRCCINTQALVGTLVYDILNEESSDDDAEDDE